MQTLYAIDLTKRPEWQKLWQANKIVSPEEIEEAGLPLGGFISPMGYFLFEEATKMQHSHQITFNKTLSSHSTFAKLAKGRELLKTSVEEDDSYEAFSLEINERMANVTISDANWTIVKEAAILIITQCWRYYSLEEEVLKISQFASDDLKRTARPKMSDWKNKKRYMEHDLTLRNLSHDLPYFDGPALDPYYYHSEPVTAAIYQKLFENLHIESWSEHLWDHVEVLKETYNSIAETFFHYELYFWTLVLEVGIVVILLINLYLVFLLEF